MEAETHCRLVHMFLVFIGFKLFIWTSLIKIDLVSYTESTNEKCVNISINIFSGDNITDNLSSVCIFHLLNKIFHISLEATLSCMALLLLQFTEPDSSNC